MKALKAIYINIEDTNVQNLLKPFKAFVEIEPVKIYQF